jgi:hypothetical protein
MRTRTRPLSELISGEATREEIEGALSARYSPQDRERQNRQAYSAGFDAVPEPEPVVVSRDILPEPEQPKPPKFVIDYPVVAFTQADIPGWGAWLLGELQLAWPGIHVTQFSNWIRGWTSANNCHFIRTTNSASLAMDIPHPLVGGVPIVKGIFCWTRFPEEKGAELHLVQLHRHTIEWARARRAMMFDLFEKSDLTNKRADFFIRPNQMTTRYVVTRHDS